MRPVSLKMLIAHIVMVSAFLSCSAHVLGFPQHGRDTAMSIVVQTVSTGKNFTNASTPLREIPSNTSSILHQIVASTVTPKSATKKTVGLEKAIKEVKEPTRQKTKRRRHGMRRKGPRGKKGSSGNGTRQEGVSIKGGRKTNFRCCRQRVQLTNLSSVKKKRINSFPGGDNGNNNSSNRSKDNKNNSGASHGGGGRNNNKCIDCRRVLLSTSEDEELLEIAESDHRTENRTIVRLTDAPITVAPSGGFLGVISTPGGRNYSTKEGEVVDVSDSDSETKDVIKFYNSSALFSNWNSSQVNVSDDITDENWCLNCSGSNSNDGGNRTAPMVILTEALADEVFTDAPEIWNQEKYLTKGINPNIEVSIEILHRDIEANKSTQAAEEKLLVSVLDQIIRSNSEFPSDEKPENSASHPKQTTEMPVSGRQGVDVCQLWMHCPGEEALLGLARLDSLPTCPCQYSFSVHYNEQIWDDRHNRFFRWRDASGPHDKLSVYQPGARWCIRSLVSETSASLAAQHCCYDSNRWLITRGSGAGTPNFVSPEVSRDLHYRVDVVPWIVCKGNWKRYHERRPPNNQNECAENPGDEEYAKQEAAATEF